MSLIPANQLNVIPVIVGDLHLSLQCAAPGYLLDWSRKYPALGAPYWGRLWPSARALAAWIRTDDRLLPGERVLEFGAGLGLPSLVAAASGATAHATDVSGEAMELLRNSATLNGFPITCEVADWNSGSDILARGWDVLLLSDVNYDPVNFEPVRRLIGEARQSGMRVFLSTPQRLLARPFVESIMPWITERDEVIIHDAARPVPVSLFRC